MSTRTTPPAVRDGNKLYVWVTVSPYYIEQGSVASLAHCPVALAIRARLPHLGDGVRVTAQGLYILGSARSAMFAPAVGEIISHYDNRGEMAPFSFLLVLVDGPKLGPARKWSASF